MDKAKFGNYIRQKRLERDLTQKELADLLLIDVTAVSKWERGVSYPDITMIPDICRHLSINEHELIESSNDTAYRTMKKEAEKYRRIKDSIFYSFSAAYFTAILTCFIVNLSVDHRLTWFFVVLASCNCGFTFLPTCLRFFNRGKLGVFVGTTFVSTAILYLTCSLYTGGRWYLAAIAGTLLGYFAVFYPVLFLRQRAYLHAERYRRLSRWFLLTYAVGLMALTLLTLAGARLCSVFSLRTGALITLYCFTVPLAWGLAEFLPVGRLLKLGLDFWLSAGYLYGLNGVLTSLLGATQPDPYHVDFHNWAEYTNGNTMFISMAVCVAVGLILMVIGAVRARRSKK